MTTRSSLTSWTPLAGLGAVLFAHFAARLGNAGGGVPSPFQSPASDIAAYYTENSTFTALSGYLYVLAAIAFVIFAAGLYNSLSKFDAEEARGWAVAGVAGGVLYSTLLAIMSLLQLALVGAAQREGASEVVAGMSVLWATTAALLVPGSVLLLLGFGMAGRRSGYFSGLVTGFALAGAVLGLVPPPEVIGPLSPAVASLMFVLSEFQPWLVVLWVLGGSFTAKRAGLAGSEPTPARDEAVD